MPMAFLVWWHCRQDAIKYRMRSHSIPPKQQSGQGLPQTGCSHSVPTKAGQRAEQPTLAELFLGHSAPGLPPSCAQTLPRPPWQPGGAPGSANPPQNLSIPAGADTDKPKQGQCLTGAANSNSNCTEHGLAWQRLHFCSEARETLSCPPWLCGLCSAQTSEVWVQGSFRAADQRPQAFSTERSRAGLARILSMKLFAVWHRRRPTSAF